MDIENYRLPGIDHDLIAKRVDAPDGGTYVMLLDPETSDPIVKRCLMGIQDNVYMTEAMLALTKPGDRIIDLGCHIGTFALPASAAGRRVTCVDANQFHVALITHDARLNHFPHLKAIWAAISIEPGLVRFSEDGLFGRIDYRGVSENTVDVPTIALDAVMEGMGGPVSFLKMDIEGAEYDALLTGERAIRRDSPFIWFESNPLTLELAGRSVDALGVLLENWGYNVFRSRGNRWIYAPPGQFHPEAWVDMIAVHHSKRALIESAIEWKWHADDMLEVCRHWASLPHHNARQYLVREIRSRPELDERIAEIAVGIEAGN